MASTDIPCMNNCLSREKHSVSYVVKISLRFKDIALKVTAASKLPQSQNLKEAKIQNSDSHINKFGLKSLRSVTKFCSDIP